LNRRENCQWRRRRLSNSRNKIANGSGGGSSYGRCFTFLGRYFYFSGKALQFSLKHRLRALAEKIVTAVITPQQGEASSNTSNTKHMNLVPDLYKFEL
jgi:hypothetical protein